MIDRDPREHSRESRAREIVREIESRKRPENPLDRAIAREKERYGRIRPSRYELNNDQRRLYEDLKIWPVMRPRDVIEFRYAGNPHRYHRDQTLMRKYGLLEQTMLEDRSVVVHRADTRYSFKDAQHDAGVYSLYERQKREIEDARCSIASVRTEAMLKSEFYSKIPRNADRQNEEIRAQRAREMNLAVVNGIVKFPDCRLAVDVPNGRDWKRETIDLELTTGTYTADQIAAKYAAGMNISGPNSHLGGIPKNVYQGFGR